MIKLKMLITMHRKVSGVTLPSKMHSIIPIVSSWSISPLWSASNLSLFFRSHLLIPSPPCLSRLITIDGHFKSPAELFPRSPCADQVVHHDELEEVHVTVAVGIKSSDKAVQAYILGQKSTLGVPSMVFIKVIVSIPLVTAVIITVR